MHKIFLAVASMIVTHFLQKAYRKITEKPTTDKDEIYRRMKVEHEALRAAATPIMAKMDAASTPRDGDSLIDSLMAKMGTVSDLKQHRSPDQADAMAMAPRRFS